MLLRRKRRLRTLLTESPEQRALRIRALHVSEYPLRKYAKDRLFRAGQDPIQFWDDGSSHGQSSASGTEIPSLELGGETTSACSAIAIRSWLTSSGSLNRTAHASPPDSFACSKSASIEAD